MGVCLTAESEDAHTSCRICFEEARVEDLISPCKCKGSLQYVHRRCLERWQHSVLKLGKAKDERAVRCGVCCTPYTHLPRRLALRSAASTAFQSLFAAGCLTLLALGVSGPPHLHLLCILVLLLAVRSQHLAACVLVGAICVLGVLYLRGLRLVVRSGGNRELGLALIRYGAPVPGLSSGVLLLASAELDGTPFARSVVLITQHGRHGAQGVILNQPLGPTDARQWSSQLGDSAVGTAAVRHYMGGPVGYQAVRGESAQVMVLHQLQGLPGARPVLQPGSALRSTSGGAVQPPLAGNTAAAVQGEPVQQQQRGRRAAAATELQRQMVEAYRRLGRPAVRSMTVNGSPPGGQQGLQAHGSTISGAATQAPSLALPTSRGADQQQQQQQQQGAAASSRHSRRDQSSSGSNSGYRFSWFHRPSLRRRRIDRSNAATAAQGQPAGTTAAVQSSLLGSGLYSGGSLEEALRLAGALKLTGLYTGSPLIHMYHGIGTWAGGQLEGEVRQGAWGYIPAAAAAAEEVVGVVPGALYGRLLQHGALRWM